MSEEKVLTLRGKKAVWAHAPAGVGGGAFIVNVTVADDGTCTADKTFAEMEEAYLSGMVLKVVEKQTTEYMTGDLVYNLNQYMSNPQQVLSFVNVMPGGANFHFHQIMFMEGMAQKMVFTMTGEFTT